MTTTSNPPSNPLTLPPAEKTKILNKSTSTIFESTKVCTINKISSGCIYSKLRQTIPLIDLNRVWPKQKKLQPVSLSTLPESTTKKLQHQTLTILFLKIMSKWTCSLLRHNLPVQKVLSFWSKDSNWIQGRPNSTTR
mmetsp:Transcript_24777/g.36341  ORF Transcript_24777/g.36341 Transcript_24777/m.36341 type:complete len:137 (-) Transcript_24777:408-818(-)